MFRSILELINNVIAEKKKQCVNSIRAVTQSLNQYSLWAHFMACRH